MGKRHLITDDGVKYNLSSLQELGLLKRVGGKKQGYWQIIEQRIMEDLEESESWHEDLMAWERFQDELERIKGENTYDYDDLQDFKNKNSSLQQKTFTTPEI